MLKRFQVLFTCLNSVIRYCIGSRYSILGFAVVVLLTRCAYFNTFYNCQTYFRKGMQQVTHDTLKVGGNDFDKTIEKATSVIVKYPRSRYVDDALFMMGASYYYIGDYLRALEKLDYLTYNYPETRFYDDALYYKGLAFYKLQRWGQAVVAFREAMTFPRFLRKASLGLSYVYYQEGDYASLTEVAGELLRQGLSKKDKRSLLFLLGEAQFKQEQYAEANGTFRELLSLTRIQSEQRDLKLRIAETYLAMGEYETCHTFLSGEVDVQFKKILADLNVQVGDTVAAKQTYLDVASSNLPTVAASAFWDLAEILRAQDSIPLAIAYYDSAVGRAPLSEYGIQGKKMADVLRRIDVLAQEAENPGRAQFLLAEIYFIDFNEPERAAREYEKVYELYPQSEWAPKALYANLWIAWKVFDNDSIAQYLREELSVRYPGSQFTRSALEMYGEEDEDLE
jgi:tetratricopeptide (TPR) repeat protein